jgi:hypothetical protein
MSPGTAMATAHEFIQPAGLSDVMYEQMDYLLAHIHYRQCPKTCRDCRRLRQVKKALLTPFRQATEIEGLYPKRKQKE